MTTRQQLVELAMAPVRVVVVLFVFAPPYTLFLLLQKLGEWMSDVFEELTDKWSRLGVDFKYLMNSSQQRQACDAVRDNKILQEQLRLFGYDVTITDIRERTLIERLERELEEARKEATDYRDADAETHGVPPTPLPWESTPVPIQNEVAEVIRS